VIVYIYFSNDGVREDHFRANNIRPWSEQSSVSIIAVYCYSVSTLAYSVESNNNGLHLLTCKLQNNTWFAK